MEDMTRIFSIENDIQDVQPVHVPEPLDGNKVGAFLRFFGERALAWEKAHKQAKEVAKEHPKHHIQIIQSQTKLPSSTPIIDLSSENPVENDVIPLDESIPITGDVNNDLLALILNLSQLHSTIIQLYDLPTDLLVGEKDFVATPTYFIKPKPVEETHPDVEMSEAKDVPTEPVVEMSPSEIETSHPKSNLFKVRNLSFCMMQVTQNLYECNFKLEFSLPLGAIIPSQRSVFDVQELPLECSSSIVLIS
nr:uncharacterized protein LOC109171684 [Ipomoea batatas]